MKKNLVNFFVWLIRLGFSTYELFSAQKSGGWLFHGYNGRAIGNNYALLKYCLTKGYHTKSLAWVGNESLPEGLNDVPFRRVPSRNAPIWEHLYFLCYLSKFQILSVESAGALRFYLRFLPRRNRCLVLLPHGFSLKATGVLAPSLTDEQRKDWAEVGSNFDIISASSQIESYMLSATLRCPIQKVKIIGQQRSTPASTYQQEEIDSARSALESFYNLTFVGMKLVVYAPTHRDHLQGQTPPCPFGYQCMADLNAVLKRNNTLLIIRAHALGKDYVDKKQTNIIFSRPGPVLDFNVIAAATDVLITDYSGIFIDFLLSDMKIAFWQYDINDFRISRGFSLPEDVFQVGRKITGPKDFEELLISESEEPSVLQSRKIWGGILKSNGTQTSLEKTVEAFIENSKN